MRRIVLSTLCALLLLASAALPAQIPPRKTVMVASTGGPRRLLVATPSVGSAAELAVAVRLAELLRRRVAHEFGARYQVVSREALNRVLAASGYEADAPLSDAAVRALGTQLQAAFVMCATVQLGADGRVSISASLAAPAEAGATRQTVTQESGQGLDALAAALTERLLQELR